MKRIANWLASAAAMMSICTPAVYATDYYVSSSKGADGNSGIRSEQPWKSFEKFNKMTMQPGDRVLLKRGDVWSQMLHLRGKGTPQKMIRLGAWGSGAKPMIHRTSYVMDRCVQIENPSCWVITDLQMQHAKIGLYLRYDISYGNKLVTVARCDFRDMPDNTANPILPHNELEIAWSAGVFVGGRTQDTGTVLSGLHIKQCQFDDLGGSGFYSAFFFPRPNRTRLVGVTMEDCTAYRCGYGIFAATGITDLLIRHSICRDGGGPNWFGACGVFIGSAQRVQIEDSEFSGTGRFESGDGEGVDIDGNCVDVTISRCLFRSNDAAGLIFLSTEGPSENVKVVDCVFAGNSRAPAHSHDNNEIVCGDSRNKAEFINCRIYKREGRGFFSDQIEGLSINDASNKKRLLSEVWGLPVAWNNLAAWSKQADWKVSPRTLFGTAAPAHVWITAKQAGKLNLQWYTETGEKWLPVKPARISLAAGDNWINLRTTGVKGVVNRLRISGDTKLVSSLRLTESNNPKQPKPVQVKPLPIRMEIACIPSQTGHVWESQTGMGTGGMPPPVGATMPFGDDVSNRASRLILSFDTSVLPKGAVVKSATLMITRVSNQGDPKNPWITPWQWLPEQANRCRIDLKRGVFGTSTGLDAIDYQAKPDVQDAGSMIIVWRDGLTGYSQLRSHALPKINLDGLTQLRMRFTYPSNRNGVPEWTEMVSGAYSDAAMRPKLVIEYMPTGK